MSHCSCVCKVGWGRVGWAPRNTPLFVAAHQASQSHAIQSLTTSPTAKGSNVFAYQARSSAAHSKYSFGRHSRKTSNGLVSIKEKHIGSQQPRKALLRVGAHSPVHTPNVVSVGTSAYMRALSTSSVKDFKTVLCYTTCHTA